MCVQTRYGNSQHLLKPTAVLCLLLIKDMLYSGDVQDICCISCTPVKELKHPVGFDSSHAFECEAIVAWITTSRNTNPLTGEQLKHTPVAAVLHPLIVDDAVDHVEETRIILDQAGWIIDSELKTVTTNQCYLITMSLNAVVYSIIVYLLALSKFRDVLGQANASIGSIVTFCLSFAHLAYETCRKYPSNGKWIMLNYCIAGSFVLIMIEILALCSPGERWMENFFVFYGAVLTSRLSFDIHQACGMNLH